MNDEGLAKYIPCAECPHSPMKNDDARVCKACEFRNSMRPHGHWIKIKHPIWKGFVLDQCSVCGWINRKESYIETEEGGKRSLAFCGNCGAIMKDTFTSAKLIAVVETEGVTTKFYI